MRGRGCLKSVADIENVVLKTDRGCRWLKDTARVEIDLMSDADRGAHWRGEDAVAKRRRPAASLVPILG